MAVGRGREGTAGAGYSGGVASGAGSSSAGGGGYTGLRDRFDGGGPGMSGPTFSGGGALSRGANAMGIAPVGQGQGSYMAGGVNTNNPASRVNRVAAAFSNPQGAPTAANRPAANPAYATAPAAERSARAAMGAPAAAPMRGEFGGGERTVMQTPVLPPVVPPTVSPSGGQDDLMTGAQVSMLNAERSRVPTYEAGGYVGKGGQPIRPSTASLDLPPALARMLDMPMQSYAEGGMVGPGGMPQRPMTSPMAMNVAQQGGAPVVGLAPQVAKVVRLTSLPSTSRRSSSCSRTRSRSNRSGRRSSRPWLLVKSMSKVSTCSCKSLRPRCRTRRCGHSCVRS